MNWQKRTSRQPDNSTRSGRKSASAVWQTFRWIRKTQKKYEAKREAWHDTVEYMSNSFRPHYGDKQTLRVESIAMDVREVRNSSFDMVTDTENQRNKAVRLAEKTFEKIQKDLPETFRLPKIAVVDFEKQGLNANAIGGYHEKQKLYT